MRAECLFEEWNQQFDPTGPLLADEDTTDVIRQSFNLDLGDLVADREPTYRI